MSTRPGVGLCSFLRPAARHAPHLVWRPALGIQPPARVLKDALRVFVLCARAGRFVPMGQGRGRAQLGGSSREQAREQSRLLLQRHARAARMHALARTHARTRSPPSPPHTHAHANAHGTVKRPAARTPRQRATRPRPRLWASNRPLKNPNPAAATAAHIRLQDGQRRVEAAALGRDVQGRAAPRAGHQVVRLVHRAGLQPKRGGGAKGGCGGQARRSPSEPGGGGTGGFGACAS